MKSSPDTAQRHLADQREYVRRRHVENQRSYVASARVDSPLVDESVLAQTMRSVRYADEAHAAADVLDNAIEAGATQIHVVFKSTGGRIEEVAFVDDASGIDHGFLPHAIKWGGTSNEGKRNVFGRFGFGLPSASVNRGTAFDVISRTAANEEFSRVTLDLRNLTTRRGLVQLPVVETSDLPGWILDYVDTQDGDGRQPFEGGRDAVRTVVVWRNLDRLKWRNIQQAVSQYREHFGITFAHWLSVVRLVVDAKPVEPVDVLFTTPGYRYYEVGDSPGAEPHGPIDIPFADSNGVKHLIKVRLSDLGVDAYDALADSEGKGRRPKPRKRIRTNYNGFFVTRNGRFIELVQPDISSSKHRIVWNPYARQVGVAIDFPPELDELFGVTPDKQTIIFQERLVALLESHGVFRAFNALKAKVADERSRRKAERDRLLREDSDAPRPSEQTVSRVLELQPRRTRKVSDESRDRAKRNFRRRVKEIAANSGLPEAQVAANERTEAERRPYKVEFHRGSPDDPFYTPSMNDVQLVLRINTRHPFFTDIYSKLEEHQAELRSALELVLWVLAIDELDSSGEAVVWYSNRRREWSHHLANCLELHPQIFNDTASKEEAQEYDADSWVEPPE